MLALAVCKYDFSRLGPVESQIIVLRPPVYMIQSGRCVVFLEWEVSAALADNFAAWPDLREISTWFVACLQRLFSFETFGLWMFHL